jgi:hypothetical protein
LKKEGFFIKILDMEKLIKLLKKGDLDSFRKAKEECGLTFREFEELRKILPVLEKLNTQNTKPTFKVHAKEVKPLKSLGWKTALKYLIKAEEYLKSNEIEKAYEALLKLRISIEQKIQKESEKDKTDNKDAQELTRWYINLWKNQEGKLPPEANILPETKLYGYLTKRFGKLLEANTSDEIKELYEFWFNLESQALPKEIKQNFAYKTLFIAKSGRDINSFAKRITLIKALKEEIILLSRKGGHIPSSSATSARQCSGVKEHGQYINWTASESDHRHHAV